MGIRSVPLLAASTSAVLYAVVATAGQVRAQAGEPTPTPKNGVVKPREMPLREPVRREVPPVPKRGAIAPAEAAAAAPAGTAATSATPSTSAPATSTPVTSAPVTSAPATEAWSEAEIQEAKAVCATVLRGVDAVYMTEDPIKQGSCGSPVVYKVTHVGRTPSVEISPPVMLTCEMIASLDKWMKTDVQPKARGLLGGAVVKIDTMSSYACRNAYGRTKSKLSEHGRVNAIDIGSFSTAKTSVSVLADWGLTDREQRAIAAKQEAERAAQAAAAATRGNGAVTTTLPGSTIVPLPSINGGGAGSRTPAVGLVPYRLGGPKTGGTTAAVPTLPQDNGTNAANTGKRNFLRDIHTAACKHFGTVLGPEANNAHKNHFHLDMAPRNRGNFCE